MNLHIDILNMLFSLLKNFVSRTRLHDTSFLFCCCYLNTGLVLITNPLFSFLLIRAGFAFVAVSLFKRSTKLQKEKM
jgi:hypothetical protein